ncbi:hypothetical protein [Pseudomonas monteilii]|nr:hypothetical protein [Pseudomonas monteilii]
MLELLMELGAGGRRFPARFWSDRRPDEPGIACEERNEGVNY